MAVSAAQVRTQTKRWVEEAVVGLNLCPFARPEVAADRVRYAVCEADELGGLLRTLQAELRRLVELPEAVLSTTLIITPRWLGEFEDYLDVLAVMEEALEEAGLEGEIQVASFHPDYRFDGEAEDALGSYTNRAPYPIFHLLRESQIEAAIEGHRDIDQVPKDNIERLEAMGAVAVKALFASFRR